MKYRFWYSYAKMIFLLTGIATGCILGLVFGKKILFLQAAGDVFLNMLFTVVVPLVFFAIASAIAQVKASTQIGRIARTTVLVMVGTVMVSALVTAVAIWWWPLDQATPGSWSGIPDTHHQNAGQVLTELLTVPEFFALFTRKSMLALIIFAVGVGVATLKAGEKGQPFTAFLVSGNEVIQRLLALLMYLAPIGLGAYFACQVASWKGDVLNAYGRSIALLSGVSIFYYIVFFSVYALLAGGGRALRTYWKYNITPSATAFATGSSIATIPANLEAATRMRIPAFIADLVIPLGGPLHKEGSAIASMVKVYLLYALFHPPITPAFAFVLSLGLAWIVSIVEGGIPNGGYIAEILTISVMGLPPEALPPIILIGTITDPISTVVNATGDTPTAMLIARITRGRRWMDEIVV